MHTCLHTIAEPKVCSEVVHKLEKLRAYVRQKAARSKRMAGSTMAFACLIVGAAAFVPAAPLSVSVPARARGTTALSMEVRGATLAQSCPMFGWRI